MKNNNFKKYSMNLLIWSGEYRNPLISMLVLLYYMLQAEHFFSFSFKNVWTLHYSLPKEKNKNNSKYLIKIALK